MPGATPSRGFPFPFDTDLVNVPGDIEKLARAVDTVAASETLRRFPSIAARNAAIPVPAEGQMCFCTVAPGGGQGMRFIGRGGEWWGLGMCMFASKSTTQGFAADGVWQLCTYPTSFWNVLSAYNGSVWTAPFKGYAHVVASITITITNAGGALTLTDGNQAAFGYHLVEVGGAAADLGFDSNFGRWGQVTLSADTVIGVEPGSKISAQGWCNAVGLTKTMHPGSGFYIEYV